MTCYFLVVRYIFMAAMRLDLGIYTNASKQQACHGVLDNNVSMRQPSHLREVDAHLVAYDS